MPTSIALFRGINVGGSHILPMKELVRELNALGLDDVRTYIQSGNVVFRTSRKPAKKLAETIEKAIEQRHGFRPRVLIISADRWRDIIDANPYPKAVSEPKTLHAFICATKPKSPDLDAIKQLASRTERFTLLDDVFYLWAPDGIGRSKLAEKVEKHLGVPTTARNWRTMTKLLEMAEE